MTTAPWTPPAGTRYLDEREVRDIVGRALASLGLAGRRVLLIVRDSTRTAPVGLLFRAIHDLIGRDTRSLDVLIALGTHPPLSDDAINPPRWYVSEQSPQPRSAP